MLGTGQRIRLSLSSEQVPHAVVLDTGPWIALFHRSGIDHVVANRGFRQLATASSRQIAPLPIVFEAYKWTLNEAGPFAARLCLSKMRQSAEIIYPSPTDFDDAADVLARMPTWSGSLEDALVAITARKLSIPVWTMNYRDFSAFKTLTFWTPS